MSFAPGDEVVCVKDTWRTKWGYGDEVLPVCGAHYIVRDTVFTSGPRLLLQEIVNPSRAYTTGDKPLGIIEPAWPIDRFRPVKRDTIEIFRAMCVSKKPLVPVEI